MVEKKKRRKIFFSVGTHPLGFERLVKYFDAMLEEKKLNAEVFGVIGMSTYTPKHFKWKRYVSEKVFIEHLEKADTVVTQGGTGTILTALLKKKNVIIVPRRKKFHEHTDDHQLDAAKKIQDEGKGIMAETKEQLIKALKRKPIAIKIKKPVKIWNKINALIEEES